MCICEIGGGPGCTELLPRHADTVSSKGDTSRVAGAWNPGRRGRHIHAPRVTRLRGHSHLYARSHATQLKAHEHVRTAGAHAYHMPRCTQTCSHRRWSAASKRSSSPRIRIPGNSPTRLCNHAHSQSYELAPCSPVERRTRTLGPTRARILSHIRPCAVCVCKPPRTPDGHADTPPRIHTPAVTRIHTQTHRSCADIRMCHVREYMCAQALPTEASINRTREHAHAHMHTHT